MAEQGQRMDGAAAKPGGAARGGETRPEALERCQPLPTARPPARPPVHPPARSHARTHQR